MKYSHCLPLVFSLLIGCSQPEQGQPTPATKEVALAAEAPFAFRDGDLIFHTSLSDQSKAIQLATKSPYSHCGIVFQQDGKMQVFEAIEPVTVTPIEQWIARGEKGRYVVRRLREAEQVISPQVLEKMRAEGSKHIGKHYDAAFGWGDDRIYCSELIWKVYKAATGLEIGKLERLRDFDLSSPTVRQLMSERYGNDIPMDEQVIAPKAVFESDLLVTVFPN
jgi:hypothetical protein